MSEQQAAGTTPKRPLYQALASLVDAIHRCEQTGNEDWEERHTRRLRELVKECLPSGSGWDCGTTMDLDVSTADHLVFRGSYHHMNENGYYDGWTEHAIHVKPSLQFDFKLTITGRNRNDIKDYLHDIFDSALRLEV